VTITRNYFVQGLPDGLPDRGNDIASSQHLIDRAELEKLRGGQAEQGRELPAPAGILVQDEPSHLGRDHRENGILHHQTAVGVGQRHSATASGFTHAQRNCADGCSRQDLERGGDFAGQSVSLLLGARFCSRRINNGEHRNT
jgi:hypothetical protein